MPWQEQVAAVATEMEDGLSAYREVIVTIPRQSGKTTLLLVLELERALYRAKAFGEQRIFYSAQTGFDARRKLIDDQAPTLMRSPLKRTVQQVRRAQGSEGIVFTNGSRIDVMASSKSAGHGRTMDLGVIDEAFDDVDDRREQAMIPAMATKPDAQLFVVSTAGTNESVYLNRKVEAGRAAAAEGRTSGVAFFEWSADADTDPADEDAWFRYMPALGRTIGVEAIRHARQSMSEGEFRRAYMNQPTRVEERVIPKDVWDRVVSESAPDGRLTFAFDVAPDRSSAAIAVADRQFRAEVIDHRAGTGWLADRLVELAGKWDALVVVDKQSAAGSFAQELEDAGVDVARWGTDEVASACGRFYDRVFDGQVKVRSHDGLHAAVAGAARRNVGDRWLWGRRTSSTDISPLVAVTLALGANPDDGGAPVVSFA